MNDGVVPCPACGHNLSFALEKDFVLQCPKCAATCEWLAGRGFRTSDKPPSAISPQAAKPAPKHSNVGRAAGKSHAALPKTDSARKDFGWLFIIMGIFGGFLLFGYGFDSADDSGFQAHGLWGVIWRFAILIGIGIITGAIFAWAVSLIVHAILGWILSKDARSEISTGAGLSWVAGLVTCYVIWAFLPAQAWVQKPKQWTDSVLDMAGIDVGALAFSLGLDNPAGSVSGAEIARRYDEENRMTADKWAALNPPGEQSEVVTVRYRFGECTKVIDRTIGRSCEAVSDRMLVVFYNGSNAYITALDYAPCASGNKHKLHVEFTKPLAPKPSAEELDQTVGRRDFVIENPHLVFNKRVCGAAGLVKIRLVNGKSVGHDGVVSNVEYRPFNRTQDFDREVMQWLDG